MKPIGVIFVLALITIAGAWYTDHAFTSGKVATTTHADPVSVGVTLAARR